MGEKVWFAPFLSFYIFAKQIIPPLPGSGIVAVHEPLERADDIRGYDDVDSSDFSHFYRNEGALIRRCRRWRG